MDLKEIATVSGKGGLFKIIKPTRTGVILESLDEQKSRLVAGTQHKVSLLKEISIYTTGKDSSVALEEVLVAIFAKYGNKIPVHAKSSADELMAFLEQVVPNYDKERVYTSDMKKLVSWYTIMSTHAPELLKNNEAAEKQSEKELQEEVKAETKDTEVAAEKPAKAKKA
jgi:hypothetical protein